MFFVFFIDFVLLFVFVFFLFVFGFVFAFSKWSFASFLLLLLLFSRCGLLFFCIGFRFFFLYSLEVG